MQAIVIRAAAGFNQPPGLPCKGTGFLLRCSGWMVTTPKGVDAWPVQGCAAGIGPFMASVAKWSKAPVCGTGDHGFESRRSPQHVIHPSRACSSTDRVLGFGPRGCGFESRQARQTQSRKEAPGLFRGPLDLDFASESIRIAIKSVLTRPGT